MRLKNIQHFLSFRRVGAFFALVLLILVSVNSPISAQTVTQGYSYEGTIQRGMIVSLKADDTTKIELSNFENEKRIHGVIVDPNDAPVTISTENQKVFVATVGRYEMLVSDQNGAIQQGDYITISSVAGIGMKADENYDISVGKALAGFDGQSGVISTIDVKDSLGGTSEARIGRIFVDIGIGANPLAKPKDSNVPTFLRKAAEAIADKPVSTVRVYLGVVILLAASAIAGSLLYGGVRSSLISIGRNPLSKKSIIRGLIQIIITSVLILLVGIFGVYLLLRL